MPSLLADRLSAARHHQFVGRSAELRAFEEALAADALPFHILYVHGPGGVGKTALLQEMRRRGRACGVPTFHLDARDLEPSAADFMHALRHHAGLDLSAAGAGRAKGAAADGDATDGPAVLFLDTFEVVAPLARWMREDFLPRLPGEMLLVLCGRHPMPPGWQADAGVQALSRTVPLRNLSPEESRRYLAQRGVPEARHEEGLRFAHGHPLALSLVADVIDQRGPEAAAEQAFEPVASPDVVGTLLKRFAEEVPTPAHRTALEACALVRATTEALLAHVLERDDVRALFEWLRTLSFIEAGREGLFPHDTAREALVADLRWRDADRYDVLHQRARRHYSEQLRQQHGGAGGRAAENVLTNYVFLYRDNPVVEPLFTRLRAKWHDQGPFVRDTVRDDDWPALFAMTARHEGAASAELLRYWKERQPGGARVFRDAEGVPAGFVLPIALNEVTDEDRAADPCIEAACAHLDAHAPLREGEKGTVFRFWMDRNDHQDLSPVQSLISAHRVRYYLTTPRLAFTFVPCATPDFWALIFAYAGLERFEEADFEVGEHAFGLFGHDWRVVPPATWLDVLAERTITPRAPEAVPPAPTASMLVLSEAAFADAVKDALQDYARLDALRGNPLLRSRLVVEALEPDAAPEVRAERLCALIEEAAKSLRAAPREAKFYRALRATYLEPEPTQERAAEALDIPFSTFRRHLKRGVEHVTDALWQQETGG